MSKTLRPMSVAVQARSPVLVIGAPGTGKTTIIEGLGKGLDLHVEVVIASLREPSDFAGLPIITGIASDAEVKLAAPGWAKRLVQHKRGLLFLDEITTAPPAVQAALLRVVLDRMVGDTKLPQEVSIVAAANPPEQAAGGWELSAPLANRFCHLPWGVEVTAWVDGMLQGFPAPSFPRLPADWQVGILEARATVAGFVRSKPQALLQVPKEGKQGEPWPSPRSWDMASKLIAANKAAGAGPESEVMLVVGCVGQGYGIEFLNWRKALDLPDPEECLRHPDKFVLPERGDISFTVLASIAAAVASNLTKGRYLSAWRIFNHAAAAGQKDVAAASVKALAQAGTGKLFLQDKEVRDEMKKYLAPFLEILRSAGLIAEAA